MQAVESNRTFTAARKRARPHGNRFLNARMLLNDYVLKHGQPAPNKEEMHLQRGTTKHEVHVEYKKQLNVLQPEEKPLEYSHFVKLWGTEFQAVKCLKSTDFARCDFCEKCQDHLKREYPAEVKAGLEFVYRFHLNNQVQARELYYRHNLKARKCYKYLSIIHDGMTQGTTRIPRYRRKAKAWEKRKDAAAGPHLATHAMGALCPGVPVMSRQRSSMLVDLAKEIMVICRV